MRHPKVADPSHDARFPSHLYRLVIFLISLTLPSVALGKVIALVFDDSGSMLNRDGRLGYASYSLQTIRALLPKADTLNVFYLNQSTTLNLGKDSPASEVKTIRARSQVKNGQGTPYSAVPRAVEFLKQSSDPDRWLVVVTDGAFARQSVPPNMNEHVRAVKADMPDLKVVFLRIGGKDDDVNKEVAEFALVSEPWKSLAGAEIIEVKGADQIIPAMSEIAFSITSLAGDIGKASDHAGKKELSFTPDFPIRRLIVFQQAPDQKQVRTLVQATTNSGTVATIDAPIQTDTPMGQAPAANVFGSVSHVSAKDGSLIPAGTPIRLVFDREFSRAVGVQIFPEVDVDLDLTVFNERGKPIKPEKGVFKICKGESGRLVARYVLPNTGSGVLGKIDKADASLQFGKDKLTPKLENSEYSHSFKAPNDAIAFRFRTAVKGYFRLQRNGEIRGVECVPRTITLATGPAGSKPRDISEPWTTPVTELEKATPLDVIPLVDGKPVSAEEFKSWEGAFVSDVGPIDVERIANGWRIRPRLRLGSPAFTPVGEWPIHVKIDSKRELDTNRIPDTISLQVADPGLLSRFGPLLLKVLASVLTAAYVIGLIRKPRFPKRATVTRKTHDTNTREAIHDYGKTFLRDKVSRIEWLIPYKSEQVSIGDLSFYARSRVAIELGRRLEGMTINDDPGSPLSAKKRVVISNGTKIEYSLRGNEKMQVFFYAAGEPKAAENAF